MRNEAGLSQRARLCRIVFCGILLALIIEAIPYLVHEETREEAAKGDIAAYRKAIKHYARDHDKTLPTSLYDLVGEKRGYIREVNLDPWGNYYVYRPAGSTYEIFSAGPDGQAGTADDIGHK
jgi:general secretion pathway protein G